MDIIYGLIILVVGFVFGRLYQRSKTLQNAASAVGQKIEDAVKSKIDKNLGS